MGASGFLQTHPTTVCALLTAAMPLAIGLSLQILQTVTFPREEFLQAIYIARMLFCVAHEVEFPPLCENS